VKNRVSYIVYFRLIIICLPKQYSKAPVDSEGGGVDSVW